MKNKITITVSGASGTGKTTIIYLIRYFLRMQGFEVEYNHSEIKNFEQSMHETMSDRLAKITPLLDIKILKEQK